MTDRLNKTSICSIIFLDIIDYSKKPVSEQIDCKNLFNSLINASIQNVAQNDRIILDTGDGAAITLMGSPEEALFIALTIRDGILDHNKINKQNLKLRIGINLGSVRVVKDINDRPNIIGDGINVAQRIMSFANENQILVSRSYFEVTSRLTNEITDMFTYSGVKQDKHIREHEVYSIKAKAESEPMPDEQFKAPPENEKAEQGVMLKDILKPSNLIIALVASVLLILMGWYVFILKPAFSESNPLDIHYTKPSKSLLSNASGGLNNVTDNPAAGKVIVTSPARDALSLGSTKAPIKNSELVSVNKKAANSEKRTNQQKKVSSSEVLDGSVSKSRGSDPSTVEKIRTSSASAVQHDDNRNPAEKVKSFASHWKKSFLTPATKPSCTQVQISMNQCQQN